jgi:hypothetical protein
LPQLVPERRVALSRRGVMVMRLRRQSAESSSPATGYVGDHADKLSHVSPFAHDEDERPSREDMDYGSTIFNRPPVPLPRFLRSAKKRRAR